MNNEDIRETAEEEAEYLYTSRIKEWYSDAEDRKEYVKAFTEKLSEMIKNEK